MSEKWRIIQLYRSCGGHPYKMILRFKNNAQQIELSVEEAAQLQGDLAAYAATLKEENR